jgi:hypothetical protein
MFMDINLYNKCIKEDTAYLQVTLNFQAYSRDRIVVCQDDINIYAIIPEYCVCLQ